MKGFGGHRQEKQAVNEDAWSVAAEIHDLASKLNDFIHIRE